MAKARGIPGVAEEQVLDSSEMRELAIANSITDLLIEREEFDTLRDCIITDQGRDHSNENIVGILARQHVHNSVGQANLKVAKEVDEGLGENIVTDLSGLIADYIVSVPVAHAEEDAPIIGDNEYEGKGADFDHADG